MGVLIDEKTLDQIDFDLIVAEDLIDAVPCDYARDSFRYKSCEAAAVVAFTCGHCGDTCLLCEPHRVMVDEAGRRGSLFACALCKLPWPRPIPWVTL
ncbi:MAG: hypothetical protein JWO98_5319 [Frankiales bacterium]|nr:hypothetical protein [Frankiales bacterium]